MKERDTKGLFLTASTLPALDEGRTGLMIDAAFAAMMKDVDDRGEDEEKRTVTIKVTMQKKGGITILRTECGQSFPAMRTNTVTGGIVWDGNTAKFAPQGGLFDEVDIDE